MLRNKDIIIEKDSKKGYLISVCDDDYSIAVVAESSQEAKKIGWQKEKEEGWDWEYCDLRVKWIRDADVSNLPFGVVEDLLAGLKAKLYSWIEQEYLTCPSCESEVDKLFQDSGKIYCNTNGCEEATLNGDGNNMCKKEEYK